ncbi:MAG: glycosyltransferase family 4 protein [Acidimicrobiales bacterium]
MASRTLKVVSGSADAPRIAFVAPRYGEAVVGGSEAVVREAAHGLAARGYRVDVLTTCAEDHYTWANELPAGVTADGEVIVRRFSIFKARDQVRWEVLQRRLMSGEQLDDGEELAWSNGRFRVPDLYLYLAGHADEYAAIVFSPYLFWTTLYCSGIAPERTILMPCLHDEPYAYLRSVSAALALSKAVWFLSEPEHQLAHRLAPLASHHTVVGAAVNIPDSYDAEGFRSRHALSRPYVLYAGRREGGKGWEQLVKGFALALDRHQLPFDLVTVGVGDPRVPKSLEDRIVDLGYLAPDEVADAFAAAEAFVQPSINESFSRTIMESWLAGTVVIANGGSEVVTWHCERSGGGLTYTDELELGQCLKFVAEAPQQAAQLALKGRDYVLANYTWPLVLDAMERSLEVLM